jgi:hypothetical protein
MKRGSVIDQTNAEKAARFLKYNWPKNEIFWTIPALNKSVRTLTPVMSDACDERRTAELGDRKHWLPM